MNVCFTLSIVFMVLKLVHVIDWSWVWILAPAVTYAICWTTVLFCVAWFKSEEARIDGIAEELRRRSHAR